MIGEAIADVIQGLVIAACFLRYADALKIGDTYASPTSSAACDIAHWFTSGSDRDRMWRRWGLENPAGLDPVKVEHDRRTIDGEDTR